MRTQSAGIRDLDKKLAQMVPQERLDRMLEGAVSNCCSKQVDFADAN